MTGDEIETRKATLTPKGRRTRERILNAARDVMEDVGYFEATVVDITQRSGVALGTFYRYFDNKDVVFMTLLEELVEQLYSSTSGSWHHDDLLDNIREATRRYMRAYYDNRRLIAAMLQMSSAVPECADLWWDLRTRTHDRMEKYVRQSPRAEEVDPKLVASALGGMVEQFCNHWFVQAERAGRRVPGVDRSADVLSQIWYRAVYEEDDS